jgi:predicted acetyltransferase
VAQKYYRRVTGCLSREDANALWHELVDVRNALHQDQKSYARRKFGKGYAIYEVTEKAEDADEGSQVS